MSNERSVSAWRPTWGIRRVYYGPRGSSGAGLGWVALLALGLLAGLEVFPFGAADSKRGVALRAAERAERAFARIAEERQARRIPLRPELDPAGTGLIFDPDTSVTTSTGALPAKQTSVNPNFAALVVAWLTELGLGVGDVIAIGYSGSFPALNAAVLAASTEMGLTPLIISSVTSSDYGATDPRFLWIEMEKVLVESGLVVGRSLAASPGGVEDQAVGLSAEGRAAIQSAIERSGVPLLEAPSPEQSLEERWKLFADARAGRPIRAYVNVGGGTVSVGGSAGKRAFEPGLNRPGREMPKDSVMGRFLEQGVPVIYLAQITELAERYGLPKSPSRVERPGEGALFAKGAPHRGAVLLVLIVLVTALVLLGRRARRFAEKAAEDPERFLLEAVPSRHARPPSREPLRK